MRLPHALLLAFFRVYQHGILASTSTTMEDQHTNLHLDIVHAIIEQFHLPDDANILSICSQVCKWWLPIARSHLFSDMQLQNIDGIVPRVEPNEKLVEWNGYYKPRYADTSLVKELAITTFSGVPILTPPILSSTLASFLCLRRLRIYFAHIRDVQSWRVRVRTRRKPAYVTTLPRPPS